MGYDLLQYIHTKPKRERESEREREGDLGQRPNIVATTSTGQTTTT